MAALIGLFAGAFIGNLLWHEWGAALGGVAGFLVGVRFLGRRTPGTGASAAAATGGAAPSAAVPGTRGPPAMHDEPALLRRVGELERRVASLERVLERSAGGRHADEYAPVEAARQPPVEAPGEASIERRVELRVEAPVLTPVGRETMAHTALPVPAIPNPLWRWFTGGNALTRIGVVALFFGVAFLLRYFAERFTLPIELRLGAVAAGGFALIGIGMRLAPTRPGYGISLQGAGAGVLYLTTYATFELFGLLPATWSVVLLVGISVLAVALAVRSDSQPLAGLAIAGGFIAPVLIATGDDPLLLFGYFALLNGAIFALALIRAWRALNAVGFAFTFVLGAVWGHRFYRPEHFAVVEPFLVLFFVYYVTIAILYARRGPLAAKDPVDALLVFGVPLAGFALQAALLRDARYGAAWSALALATLYAVLFLALRSRKAPGFPLLSRAFLTLAVIFATIAVPFALDNRETAALWAVEAAGVYWIGLQQRSRVFRGFALAVEIGAGIVFAAAGSGGDEDRLFANAFFMGAMLIAVSGLVTAWLADRSGEALPSGERSLVPLVFGWGVVWWLAAGSVELVRQLSPGAQTHAILAWVSAGVGLALALRVWLAWPRLAGAGVALLPTMGVAALADFDLARTSLTMYGWLVWPCAWFVHGLALRAIDGTPPGRLTPATPALAAPLFLASVHAFSALALTVQLAWEASEWTGRWTPPYTAWTPCAAAIAPIAYLWLTVRLRGRTVWPVVPHGHAYAIGAGLPIATLLAVWFVAVNVLSPGDASPLPYVPLASPLDLTLALALWALAAWAVCYAPFSGRARYRLLGAGLFIALNGVVLRAAHHWADIPWRLGSLLASKPLQAALTLTWTATALSLMVAATKRQLRPLWMLGAGLLAVVVGKLFLVDLAALTGLPRVVAFLGVGVLLLAVGYLAPLPPAARDEGSGGEGRPAG